MNTIETNRIDALIWDMDGVIVDVTNSYREAIRQTAQYFLNRKVSNLEVQCIKAITGMNNDWDATYSLIKNIKDSSQIKKNSTEYLEYKNYFQSIYLGEKLFNQCYKKISQIKKDGLINAEKLFINSTMLDSLKRTYKKMGIATGRPRFEANYLLSKYKIDKYFDSVICMEDTILHKPNPEPILEVIKKLEAKSTIYIGDSINDVEAAKSAGIKSIFIGSENLGDLNFINTNKLLNYLS